MINDDLETVDIVPIYKGFGVSMNRSENIVGVIDLSSRDSVASFKYEVGENHVSFRVNGNSPEYLLRDMDTKSRVLELMRVFVARAYNKREIRTGSNF